MRYSPDLEREDVVWLARCILSETNRPSEMYLVAWAVRNRKDSGYRGKSSYKSVVLDPWQFSAFNRNSPHREYYMDLRIGTRAPMWDEAVRIAFEVAGADPENNPIPGVRHYYSPRSMRPRGSRPAWAREGELVLDLGDRFKFYRGVR